MGHSTNTYLNMTWRTSGQGSSNSAWVEGTALGEAVEGEGSIGSQSSTEFVIERK